MAGFVKSLDVVRPAIANKRFIRIHQQLYLTRKYKESKGAIISNS